MHKHKPSFVGIIGARKRNSDKDYRTLKKAFFDIYKDGDIIVSGGCKKGGDFFAEYISERYGIPILIFPPNKDKHGTPACYFVRNTYIAQFANKALVACVSEDRRGGTEDTLEKHKKYHPKTKRILV